MTIAKVLNNNVAVTTDEDGREIVVMGRGLGFQKKAGDEVDADKIEKIFTITDSSVTSKFHSLMSRIPMAHMLLSERIIHYAHIHLGTKLAESIYVTLPDHLSAAIERYQQGITLNNPLLWDIRRFYKEEFEVGLKANEIVQEETGIVFQEDEAAFIAMHFVNAQLGEQMDKMYGITYVMQEVCAIVRMHYETKFDETTLSFYRFITHLKFFAQRVIEGEHYADDMAEYLEVLRYRYKDAYECVLKIKSFIQDKYDYTVGEEEMLYLTVHVARLSKEKEVQEEA